MSTVPNANSRGVSILGTSILARLLLAFRLAPVSSRLSLRLGLSFQLSLRQGDERLAEAADASG
ncbi:MAG: hypothetical protein M3021_09780 [Actinomycetota bacterium]|nr:hypothetical protein [Actinomycetota bacterium]